MVKKREGARGPIGQAGKDLGSDPKDQRISGASGGEGGGVHVGARNTGLSGGAGGALPPEGQGGRGPEALNPEDLGAGRGGGGGLTRLASIEAEGLNPSLRIYTGLPEGPFRYDIIDPGGHCEEGIGTLTPGTVHMTLPSGWDRGRHPHLIVGPEGYVRRIGPDGAVTDFLRGPLRLSDRVSITSDEGPESQMLETEEPRAPGRYPGGDEIAEYDLQRIGWRRHVRTRLPVCPACIERFRVYVDEPTLAAFIFPGEECTTCGVRGRIPDALDEAVENLKAAIKDTGPFRLLERSVGALCRLAARHPIATQLAVPVLILLGAAGLLLTGRALEAGVMAAWVVAGCAVAWALRT